MERVIYILCYAVSLLPWRVLFGISSALAWIISTFHIYRYKVVSGNIAMAFPEKTDKERKAIVRGFYRHLADSLMETLKMLSASDAALRRRVEFVGWEQLQEQLDKHQSVVLYLGHYGNWELVPTITWVIPQQFIMAQIYKAAHYSPGHSVMDKIRNRFGAVNLEIHRAALAMLRWHKQGKISITGFIADQRPNGHMNNWTTFLGLRTAYMAGGEEIGRRIDAAYYYLDVEVIGRGRARFTLKPVVADDDEPKYPMTVGYLRMLEATIRRNPAPWLWSHKRWAGQLKTSPD